MEKLPTKIHGMPCRADRQYPANQVVPFYILMEQTITMLAPYLIAQTICTLEF